MTKNGIITALVEARVYAEQLRKQDEPRKAAAYLDGVIDGLIEILKEETPPWR